MLRFVALVAFVGCAFASSIPAVFEGRIVNGVDAAIEDYPYQVSLQINEMHYCGGSIISEDIVVTAAHCMVFDVNDFKVRLGSAEGNNGGELVAVKAFKRHEDYNPETVVYDVAVVKLVKPVPETSKIRYIKLAEVSPPSGITAVVTGWGAKCYNYCYLTEILQKVEVDIVDAERCASDEFNYGDEIKESMICAYGFGKDSCQGDSGGPLVARNELVGIVSWGEGCAFEGYPGVYCDVASVRSWIEKTAQEL